MSSLTWGQFLNSFGQAMKGDKDWAREGQTADIGPAEEGQKRQHQQKKKDRSDSKKPRAGRTSSFTPDAKINDLALIAAQWLADNWQSEAGKVGAGVFVAQRFQEIIAGNFPSKYWDTCPLVNEETRSGSPNIDYNAPQPPAKFVTPGSLNTICKYTTTLPDSGNAKNAGHTTPAGYFIDDYLKQKNYTFQIPKQDIPTAPRPLFTKQTAVYSVAHTHKNRQAFSNLFKSSLAPTQDNFSLKTISVDQSGRFFYWHKATPPINPQSLTAQMTRSFVVDANYKSWNQNYIDQDGGFALVQVAPAPPRGTYRFKSLSVFVDQLNTIELFVGRPENEDPEPTKNGFFFKYINGSGYNYRQLTSDTGTQNGTWEIFGTAYDESWMAAATNKAIDAWNTFFPEDRFPGWPNSVTRHVQLEDGSASNGYGHLKPYGSRSPYSSFGEQMIFQTYYNNVQAGDMSVFNWLSLQSGFEMSATPGGTPNTYWKGAASWHRRDTGNPPRTAIDSFIVVFSINGFSVSWNWPGSSGSIIWKFGDPYPALPQRPTTEP